MSYSGLGITQSGSNTILDRGADVRALQQRLVAQGDIPASAADGVVSSGTSPTLRAVQASAQAMGLATTTVTRTSTGGLQLPTSLYRTIMDGPAPVVQDGDAWVSDVVKQVTSKVTGQPASGDSGYSSMFIWLATGTALLVVGGMAMYAGRRAQRTRRRSTGATIVPTPRTIVERSSQRPTVAERGLVTVPTIRATSAPTVRANRRRRR